MARKRAISRRNGNKYFHPWFTRLGTQYFTYKDFNPCLMWMLKKQFFVTRKKEKRSTLFAQESRKRTPTTAIVVVYIKYLTCSTLCLRNLEVEACRARTVGWSWDNLDWWSWDNLLIAFIFQTVNLNPFCPSTLRHTIETLSIGPFWLLLPPVPFIGLNI